MRLRKLKSKLLLLAALLSFGSEAFAQRAKYMAELPKPPKSDFYMIELQPGITAKANADLSDIRIVDAAGRAVPYIFGDALPPANPGQHFIYYKQIPNNRLADTVTTFTVEYADESIATSQFTLIVRNTAVGRMADLSGSDDLQNWYAIKEGIALQKTNESDSTNGTYRQLITFPTSSYRYYRLKVNNGKHDPVAILAAGIYGSQINEKPAIVALNGLKFSQKDTAKMSRVWVELDNNYRINNLSLTIGGAKYYKRNIRLYKVKGAERDLLVSGFISSADEPYLTFSAKTRQLLLEIDNEDNPPLVITKVEAGQLQQSLIAYLDGGKDYKLLFGDTAATSPNYDLHFFADSVTNFTASLTPGAIKVNQVKVSAPAVSSKSLPTWALWVIIGAVIAALGALTFKMTQEVGKRNSK